MSSFIVEEDTINRILTFLEKQQYSHGLLGSSIMSELKEYGIHDFLEDKDIEVFGNLFLLMNKKAVDVRYNEANLIQEHKFKRIKSGKLQVLKSIHCLLYQCYEGDIPETRLFKTMDKIKQILANNIICDLPGYDKATWG